MNHWLFHFEKLETMKNTNGQKETEQRHQMGGVQKAGDNK